MKIEKLIDDLVKRKNQGQTEVAVCVRSNKDFKHFTEFGTYDSPNFFVIDIYDEEIFS